MSPTMPSNTDKLPHTPTTDKILEIIDNGDSNRYAVALRLTQWVEQELNLSKSIPLKTDGLHKDINKLLRAAFTPIIEVTKAETMFERLLAVLEPALTQLIDQELRTRQVAARIDALEHVTCHKHGFSGNCPQLYDEIKQLKSTLTTPPAETE